MAQPDELQRAKAFCREIFPDVSRTFALSIRLIPGELGAAVRYAYLICRIADTIEDEPQLPAVEKASLLDLLTACFDDAAAATQLSSRAATLEGDERHLRLVRNTDLVFTAFRDLPESTRQPVRHWVGEMIAGMRKFVLAYPNGIRIQTLDEYKEYCYYVAGTVGFLLTDLWHEYVPSIGPARYRILRDHCQAFAEALQTVNILKDVARDAEHENSIYVPEALLRAHGSSQATLLSPEYAAENRAALATLIELAWHDLDEATAYLLTIPRRAVSIRLFCALPLLFAYATLRDLTRSPDALQRREVVKISRSEVKTLSVRALLSVGSNRLMTRLVERTRHQAPRTGARYQVPEESE